MALQCSKNISFIPWEKGSTSLWKILSLPFMLNITMKDIKFTIHSQHHYERHQVYLSQEKWNLVQNSPNLISWNWKVKRDLFKSNFTLMFSKKTDRKKPHSLSPNFVVLSNHPSIFQKALFHENGAMKRWWCSIWKHVQNSLETIHTTRKTPSSGGF